MRIFTFLLILVVACAGICVAQGLHLAGVVRDEAGMPVADAVVRLITNTQGTRLGSTNSKGEFLFRDLGNGNYVLEFEKEGYVTMWRQVEVTFDKNGDSADDDDAGVKVTMVRAGK